MHMSLSVLYQYMYTAKSAHILQKNVRDDLISSKSLKQAIEGGQ